MTVETLVSCAQCGREAPADPVQLLEWRHGELVLADVVDDVTAAMIVCPDCDAADRLGDYDSGAGD